MAPKAPKASKAANQIEQNLNINTIFNKHYSEILNYVTYRIKCYNIAQELTSDTFLKASAALNTFDKGQASLTTWLHTIANNTIKDYLRSRQHKIVSKEENVSDYTDENGNELYSFISDSDASSEVESSELIGSINKAFAALPPKYKQIADLFFTEQLSHEEISTVCEIPVNHVKQLILRCKAKLQSRLQTEKVLYNIAS
jgi:RNA polymerase sigma-70 factor (ECF subfamily)